MADPSARNAPGISRANAINTNTNNFYESDPFDDGGAGIDWSSVPDGPAPPAAGGAASAAAARPQNQPYGQQQQQPPQQHGQPHNQYGQPMQGIGQGERYGRPSGPVATTAGNSSDGNVPSITNTLGGRRPGSGGSVGGGGSRRVGTAYNPYGSSSSASTTAQRSSYGALHGSVGSAASTVASSAREGRESLGSAASAAGSASGGILTDAAVVDGIGRSGNGMSGTSSGSAMGGATNVQNMSGGSAPVNLSGNAPQPQQPGNANIQGDANGTANATKTANAPNNDATTATTATTTTSSNQDLLRQIEALTSQLSTRDEEIFNLQIQLTTVEAEASHKTSAAEKVADQKVRAVEDKLRMVQREADSARAGYARERSRRAKGGGGGGGDVPPPPPQQQQQQQQQQPPTQQQQPRTAVKGTGCVQMGSQVVTPPAALESAGGIGLRDDKGIGGMNAGSGRGGMTGAPMLSRSQRLATHLLLRIDELWPDEETRLAKGDDDAVSPTTIVDEAEDEEGPQSKRRKRREDHSINVAAANDSVPMSLMRSSAIRPGSREAAMLTQPQRPAAASTATPASSAPQPLIPRTKEWLNVTDTQGKEKASIRDLLTQVVSWEYDGGNTQSPPSVAVLVRDIVQRIASKFADVDVAVAAATSEEGTRMDVDSSNNNQTDSKASSAACTDLPTILENSSWPAVVRLLVILQEIMTFSSEAREVLRTWLARTIDPQLRSASEEDSTSIVSLSKTASRISVFGNVVKPSDHVLTELSSNTREILHSGPDGFAGFVSRSSSGVDCWNQESIEMFCGKLRDILCGAILGRYSLRSTGSKDDGQNPAILNLEKEASNFFLTVMSDAPTPSGIDDLGVWSVWYDELLPSAFIEEPVPVATTDLISILEDRSTLPRDLPSRRREKKKVRSLPNRAFSGINDGSGNFVLEMKCRSLEILLCIITCCDESRKRFPREDRLARQALAALLDEVDGSILPALSKFSSSTDNHDTSRSLRFGLGIVSYLTLLCRSEEGFEVLRTSMTVDYRGSGTRELASSGVAAMVDILQCAILYASKGSTSDGNSEHMSLWQRLLDETLEFFHLVYFQVTRIRLRATDVDDINLPTVLASVGERREIFICCIHHIRSPSIGLRTTLDSANNRHIATMLLKELGYDIEEEDA